MRVTGDNDDSTSRPTGFAWARALCPAALGLATQAEANTSNGYNLPLGVTSLSRDIYALHMEVFWICVANRGGGIRGDDLCPGEIPPFSGRYTRHHLAAQHHGGDRLDRHSGRDPVVMAIPAANVILMMEDTRQLRTVDPGHRLSVEVAVSIHGRGRGVDFFSTLARDSNFRAPVAFRHRPKTVPNYLLEVDRPMVIPSGTKVRLLLTSRM